MPILCYLKCEVPASTPYDSTLCYDWISSWVVTCQLLWKILD